MQVLCASVSSALALTGKEEFKETSKFCQMFDKFFDCLNTRRAGEGKQNQTWILIGVTRILDLQYVCASYSLHTLYMYMYA